MSGIVSRAKRAGSLRCSAVCEVTKIIYGKGPVSVVKVDRIPVRLMNRRSVTCNVQSISLACVVIRGVIVIVSVAELLRPGCGMGRTIVRLCHG